MRGGQWAWIWGRKRERWPFAVVTISVAGAIVIAGGMATAIQDISATAAAFATTCHFRELPARPFESDTSTCHFQKELTIVFQTFRTSATGARWLCTW